MSYRTLSPIAFLIVALAFASCKSNRGNNEDDARPDVEEDAGEDDAVEGDAEDDGDADDVDPDVGELCVADPPPRAMLRAGEIDEEIALGPGGRGLSTPGTTLEVLGFPSTVQVTPDSAYAYVLSTSADDRRVFVVDVAAQEQIQDVDLGEAFYGIILDGANMRLYVSGGQDEVVHAFDIGDDGLLTEAGAQEVGAYVSGLAVNPDGSRLFVGSFNGLSVVEVDTAQWGTPEALVAEYEVSAQVWDIEYLSGSDQIVTTTLQQSAVNIIDRATATTREPIEVGRSPMGMAVSPSGSVFIAVSALDRVIELDPDTGEIVQSGTVAEDDHLDEEGNVLERSNPNDVAFSADGAQIYVSRGADNAVAVLDATDLAFVGSFPTTWYPTGVGATPDGAAVIVSEGRGYGSGPNDDGGRPRYILDGNISIVPLDDLDLEQSTSDVIANFNRPTEVFPFECDGFFPVPTRPDQETPIEHIILVVKENKTFDCVFGDLEGLDVDVDPSLVRWGEDITPNQHALVREFNISDNFYVEVENSDMGHLTLTNAHLTDFVERVWIEKGRSGEFQGFQLQEAATPEDGNLFTHLMDNGIDIQVYGQIVGMFATAESGEQPFAYSDQSYPGGPFYNMDARDSARAEYVVEQIESGNLASFTFMLLPNDHTGGAAPGNPTPEAEVADNDEAVGILVEGLSNSEYWENTLIIVVQDDPQGCTDHVDSHRSFVMMASPWVRRGYISHVNYSFQSVFATILRILGVPPMGRPDASASPMWDFFSATPDFTPFTALPRNIAEEKVIDLDTPGARESMEMDFRSPDRNEDLAVVLDNYRLWRMGRLTREEAQVNIDAGIRSLPAEISEDEAEELREEMEEEAEEEAEEERFAFDESWERYEQWLMERDMPLPELSGAPLDEDTIDAVMSGDLPVTEFQWIDREYPDE